MFFFLPAAFAGTNFIVHWSGYTILIVLPIYSYVVWCFFFMKHTVRDNTIFPPSTVIPALSVGCLLVSSGFAFWSQSLFPPIQLALLALVCFLSQITLH